MNYEVIECCVKVTPEEVTESCGNFFTMISDAINRFIGYRVVGCCVEAENERENYEEAIAVAQEKSLFYGNVHRTVCYQSINYSVVYL